MHPEQQQNIERVEDRIGRHVLAFCRERLARAELFGVGAALFHMADLTAYVRKQDGSVAPDSAGRILRSLRQKGAVAYSVEKRSESLYRVTAVRP